MEAVPALKRLAEGSGPALPRIHALWALHGLDSADERVIARALATDEAQLQIAALRTGEQFLATNRELVEQTIKLISSTDAELRVQALLSLGEAVDQEPVQQALMAFKATDEPDPLARCNSLGEGGAALLATVAEQARSYPDGRRIIEGLAAQITYRQDDDGLREAVALAAASSDTSHRHAIIKGLSEGLRAHVQRGKKKVEPRKQALDPIDGFGLLVGDRDIEEPVADIARYARWPLEAEDNAADPNDHPAVIASMKRGEKLYEAKACFACHGADAGGSQQAPSLIASELVAADASVPIRIVLHGMSGDRTVDGIEYRDLVMPPNGHLVNDQELADILTWIRVTRSDDANDAITPDQVKTQRQAHNGHGLWQVQDLRP